MNERANIACRMLSEAKQRIDEFAIVLASESKNKTTQLIRPLTLLKTSFRNINWIIDAPSCFDLSSECVARAKRLKPQIKKLINNVNLQISENRQQRSGGKRSTASSHDLTIGLEGNGILTSTEINWIDCFIKVLEEAPFVDYMALHESNKEVQYLEIDRVFSDGLTFGEATNAHPILNQPEKEFRAALKAINNNIIEQIKIIEHYLPRWLSMGDFPPPYFAWRVAVTLRKAKEHGRERQFLRAYLINFRSRFGGSRRDETLIERASDMGIQLPPVR